MTYAHLAMNMREADFLFKAFTKKYKKVIAKTEKTSGIFTVIIVNGDEHCFMNCDMYNKWHIGRTYIMDGGLYHSGVPYEARRRNETDSI